MASTLPLGRERTRRVADSVTVKNPSHVATDHSRRQKKREREQGCHVVVFVTEQMSEAFLSALTQLAKIA